MTFVMGVGIAISQPAMPSLVALWAPDRIGVATASFSNGFLIGEILPAALTVPSVLSLVGGWEAALAFWSVPVALTALAIWILTPHERRAEDRARPLWLPDWRDPTTWRLGICLGTASAAYFGLNSNTLVSQVEVTWPSGIVQTVTNLAADQRMTIVEQASAPPEITVTSPNGKETWIKGTTHTVTWTDNISGNVKIKLLSGRTTVATIAASTPSDGSFDWTIPTSLTDGSKYKVEVSSLDDRTIKDQSDRTFTLASSDALARTDDQWFKLQTVRR